MSALDNILRSVIEWPARNKSLADLGHQLDKTGVSIAQRFRQGADNERNRERIAHITGIERWGQRRLRVALGEPLVMDEYDGYRPDKALGVPQLAEAFAQTRAETLDLIRRLRAAAIPPTRTVPHNQFGDLSLRAWLAYLENHAWRESFVVR
jgi:hypothetical protein